MRLIACKILFVVICCLSASDSNAGIYICVDADGTKHYSDKKCPTQKKQRTEIMDTSGRKAVPQSVLQYTPILQILKRALLLIKQEMPNDEQYQRAYNYTLKAERYHTNYIYSQKSQFPENYSPFDSIELTNIVAAISHACRAQAFMSVCGVIEGNAWLNGQERIYLSDRLGQGLNYFVTPEARNDKCKKAVNAHAGGVISSNMRSYFCEAGD